MYSNHWTTLFKLNFYSKARGYSPILLFLLAPLYLSKSYAGVIRHDIDYSDYIQFGNNAGKYAAGNQNVAVYKKDGNQNIGSREADGKNSIPLMPDFYSVSDKGFATPFSYNMVVTAAHMKERYTNETYGKRFYRTDLSLFENSNTSDKDIKEQTYLKFILSAESIARNEYGYKPDINSINGSYFRNAEDIGVDTSVIRTDKMMFDTIPYPVATFSNVAKEDLLARNGAGIFLQPLQGAYSGTAGNVSADSYRYIHGSLTQVKEIGSVAGQNVSFWLDPESQTALDSSSMGGDSGSPVFWWDKTAQNWLLLGINSQGGNNAKGYGKIGIMQTGNLTQVLNNTTATQNVTDGQIIKIDTSKNNIADFQLFSDGQKQASLELYKRRVMGLYHSGTRPWVKDLYLNNSGDGSVTLQIDGDTNIGTIPLYFNSNATIQGQGKFDLSGFSVAEGKTVTSNLTLAKGSDWRKVGAGTLRIAGTAPGQGSLAVGEGTLELANQGTAADKVMLATGRGTVKLINPNQLNNNQIYFGVRGGKLDLNGHSLSFNDIYHLDRGANISNENHAQKSTFTFTADGERNYLGSFNGNLDLQYKPSQPTALWHLRGDSRIEGNLHIQQGRVNVAADRLIYTTILRNGYDIQTSIGDADRREWRPNSFQAKTITLDNGAILGIGRAAAVIADTITFAGNNQLEIAVQDSKRHNADAASIKGDKFLDPTFHDPSLKANLQFNGDNNQINITTPDDFTTTIEGGMHGAAAINTAGKGRVIWKNNSPTVLQTKITAKDTALQIDNSASLDLSLSSNSDNIVLNNQKQATLRFAPSATVLGENTKINLDNDSQLTFAGMSQNTTQRAVAINANINTVNNNGVLPTITLSDENTTFHFKQSQLDSNLTLKNGALGLHNALTISGDFSTNPEYALSTLVFGNINQAQLKPVNGTEYELTNKLTVNGHVSGVVQPVFSLSDEVTTMLVDSVQKLTFVDYNSGSLYFINAPRIVNKGVEFSFTQDDKHTFLIDQAKISAAEKAAAEKAAAEKAAAEQAAAEKAAADKAAAEQAAAEKAAAEKAAAEKAAAEKAAAEKAAAEKAAAEKAAAEQAAAEKAAAEQAAAEKAAAEKAAAEKAAAEKAAAEKAAAEKAAAEKAAAEKAAAEKAAAEKAAAEKAAAEKAAAEKAAAEKAAAEQAAAEKAAAEQAAAEKAAAEQAAAEKAAAEKAAAEQAAAEKAAAEKAAAEKAAAEQAAAEKAAAEKAAADKAAAEQAAAEKAAAEKAAAEQAAAEKASAEQAAAEQAAAEKAAAEKAAAEQAAAEKAAAEQAAAEQAAAEQAAAEKAAAEQAAAEKAAAEKAAAEKAAAEQAAKISLSVKTAPEVGEYLTLIGSARNIVNINLNNAQSGFSVAYEGYYERDNYQHQYNFKSKVNGKGVVFNLANRLNDIEGGLQIRLADLATSTESDKVRLQSKTKLTSVIGYGGYYFDELKLYAALGVAKARFNTKIDGQAPTSMNSHFSSTGIFAKGGISYTQPFGNISLKEYIALSYNNLGLGELTDSNGDKIEVSDKLPLSSEVGVMVDYNGERWSFNAGIGVSYDLGKLQVRYKDTDRNYSRGTGKLKFNLDLGSSYKLAQHLYLTQDVKFALDSNHYQNAIFNLGVKFTW